MTTSTAAPQTNVQFSERTVPWMKIGKLVDGVTTAAEAALLGGLNFEVEKKDLFYGSRDTKGKIFTTSLQHIAERSAIVRADTGEWLGIMSDEYPVLQYREAFDFMDSLSPKFVAAGALYGGRQGFMVVQSPDQWEFKLAHGTDTHHLYLVLRTSHDGSRAVEVSVNPLRGRCMNQLTLKSFVSGVPHRWSVPHTSTMAAKLAAAHQSLKKLGEYGAALSKLSDRLVDIKVGAPLAELVLKRVISDRPKALAVRERILTMWNGSPTVGYAGTGWGLVNAISEYFEWERGGGTPASRFTGALQGQSHQAINRAAGLLLSRA